MDGANNPSLQACGDPHQGGLFAYGWETSRTRTSRSTNLSGTTLDDAKRWPRSAQRGGVSPMDGASNPKLRVRIDPPLIRLSFRMARGLRRISDDAANKTALIKSAHCLQP
jgi:hypothetical protein